jgi:hypothetical protein
VNGDGLQRGIDRARAAGRQRWVLGAVALVAAIAASAAANVVAHRGSPFLLGLVVVLALAAVAEPDSHTGTWVVVIVVGQWVIVVDDITTPLAVVAAVCLLVFHGVVALMAAMPPGATVDRVVARRWSARAAAVVAGTGAMWALVATADHWQLPGGAALTAAAFVVLTTVVVALVVRAHP